MNLNIKTTLTILAAAVLVACGGSDDEPAATADAGGGGVTGAAGQAVSGVLVVPLSATASSAAALRRQSLSAGRIQVLAFPGCPDVPDGYQPLASVSISFTDSAGAVLSTLATNACGAFSGTVPTAATVATAQPGAAGSPITQPVSSLITVAGAPANVVSTLPSGASYVISVVQDLGGGKIAMTVSDSLTGKAVLGLAPSDFAFNVANLAVGLTSLTYGSSQSQGNASVSLVLDSSGSMGLTVGTTGKSRYQVAALAAHELLNGLRTGADEANVTLFSSNIFPINDAALAALTWVDTAGAAIPDYTFSVSGATRNIASLRPVIDAYNPQSKIYFAQRNNTLADAAHPDTGNRRIQNAYPYSGSTAFYDGTISGINSLSNALNPRKIVVSMTDGQENSSSASLADLVAAAKAQGVPVFTVAFGAAADVDEVGMQSIADQTGGQYKRVEGLDLAGLFQGIQTGIRFQYVATLAAVQTPGSTLEITLNRGGTPVTRTLTIQ